MNYYFIALVNFYRIKKLFPRDIFLDFEIIS